ACSTGEVTEKFPNVRYSFRSFTFLGEMVGDGSLYISKTDSVSFEGNWSIRDVKGCVVCGPQFGGGFLTGRREGDSVYFNLNPDNPENYVELVGTVDGENFSGDWRWFKLILNSNRGTFEAVKE
ncbi:MAG: hypothetical protein OQK57_05465, partial [Ignavibacteriaceae bacterium]|nr:hypothetical protein [Ignavibacteriaceae bacterium]